MESAEEGGGVNLDRTSIMGRRAAEQDHGLTLPHRHRVPGLPAEVLQNCWTTQRQV